MEGVTAALVLFLLACLAIPRLVKNQGQYYAAVALVMAVIFLQCLVAMIGGDALGRFLIFMIGLFQIAAMLMSIMCCGGLGGEWAAGLSTGIEVIRRGQEQKQVIVPLSDEAYKTAPRAPAHQPSDEPPPPYRIETPPRPQKVDDTSPIPLE